MKYALALVMLLGIFLTVRSLFSTSVPPAMPENKTSVHDFTATSIDGKLVNLGDYHGKVLVIVNVASKCGYTRQYEGLEQLYKKYKAKGVVVMGFPANNYGGQEPGSNEEIQQFCSTKFNVSFPMFAKVSVDGKDRDELFQFLTAGGGKKELEGNIRWNFEKFVIDKQGNLVKRFGSGTEPMSDEMISTIEGLL